MVTNSYHEKAVTAHIEYSTETRLHTLVLYSDFDRRSVRIPLSTAAATSTANALGISIATV